MPFNGSRDEKTSSTLPIFAIVSLAVFFGLLQVISTVGIVNTVLFPPPSSWAEAMTEMAESGELLRDVAASLQRLLAGLVAGSVVGIVLGLLTGRMTYANQALTPLLNGLRSLPPVALIPLFILWLGIGETAKVIAIGFAVMFPVWVNTHSGVRSIPKSYLRAAATFSCAGVRLYRRVVLPAAIPFIATGIRVGIAVGFIMVFVSELTGASAGVGYQIAASQLAYRIDRMLAALSILGFMGAALDAGFVYSVRRMFPWMDAG